MGAATEVEEANSHVVLYAQLRSMYFVGQTTRSY